MNYVMSLVIEGQILGGDNAISLGRSAEAVAVLQKAFNIADDRVHQDPNDENTRGKLEMAGYPLASILRHSDPWLALEVYDQVLVIVASAYVDASKIDINSLFQQGVQELRYDFDEDVFVREYLPGAQPSAVARFKKVLDGWGQHKVKSRTEAREEVLALIQEARRADLDVKALAVAVGLEFASGACNALDEYTLFLTPGYYNDVQAALQGKYVSIGVDLTGGSIIQLINNFRLRILTVTGVTVPPGYSQTNDCTTPLIAGSSCIIKLTFTPPSAGTFSGPVTVNTDQGSNSVDFTGQGIN